MKSQKYREAHSFTAEDKIAQQRNEQFKLEALIEDNNKMIAEFLGGNALIDYLADVTPTKGAAKYNTSWDWLMPVLDKIVSINPDNGKLWFEYQLSRSHCRIWSNRGLEIKQNSGTTHSATYSAVVQFIQWYNKATLAIPNK